MGYLLNGLLQVPDLECVAINIFDDASFYLANAQTSNDIDTLILYDQEGIPIQCDNEAKKNSDAELVVGIDFGTSKTKVAIGDRQIEKSYAVPFKKKGGVDDYLLPSTLYVTRGNYSLSNGQQKITDLKINLLSNPTELDNTIHVIAYFSLIIRHVRGWLFQCFSDLYRDKEILWTLAAGIPTLDKKDQNMVSLYKDLLAVSWRVANKNKAISRDIIKLEYHKYHASKISDDDPEFRVIPELSAQIFGFVVSNSFDVNAKNIYMMFDVGGGSLDSAIFHVKKTKGQRWGFSYFNAKVSPLGVHNLHHFRLAFWENLLAGRCGAKVIRKQIKKYTFDSEKNTYIPNSYLEYFNGVSLTLGDQVKSDPDLLFKREMCGQVRGEILANTVTKLGMLSKEDVKDLPFYACGGGSKMKYYHNNLVEELTVRPANSSWLYAARKVLPFPTNFVVEGLRQQDYDRLSVAYGLSQLELDEKQGWVWPEPLSSSGKPNEYPERQFISKDMV